MNKIDKWIYDALKFFSDRTLNEVLEIKRNNLKKYHKKVPKGIEDSLHKEGYISFIKYKDGRDEDSAITTKGLEQLRILENIKIKETSKKISLNLSYDRVSEDSFYQQG